LLPPSSGIALMMEASRTSETLVNFYQTARRYNPEDSHIRKSEGYKPLGRHRNTPISEENMDLKKKENLQVYECASWIRMGLARVSWRAGVNRIMIHIRRVIYWPG
jgi:hypothetical protein